MTTPATSTPERSLARNVFVSFAGTLGSRVLGLLRESLIAYEFDRASTDVFYVVWRVPNALRAMLAEGADRYVYNPVLGDALHPRGAAPDAPPDREAFRRTLAEVRGASLVVFVLVTLLGIVFARPLFALLSGGFHGDVARFELGVTLLRVVFPFVVCMGWFAIGNSALRLVDRFRPGAFAPMLFNVAFLLVPAVLLPVCRHFGLAPIFALAGGGLAGALAQALALRPALVREGIAPPIAFRDSPAVRKLASLFVPQLYGQAVYQVQIIVAGRLLSGLATGSASYFNYAQRLADIPQGLFAVALAGATAAAMQRNASLGNHAEVARTFERAMRMAAFVALPTSVLLGVYGEAIVPLVFAHGRFRELGHAGTDNVVASLRWQSLAIALNAFVQQLTVVFGAYKQRRAVVQYATVSLVVFALVGKLATARFGHVGVAIAMTASTAAQLALLLPAVRKLVPVRYGDVAPSLARVLAATGGTALVGRAIVEHLPVTGFTLGARALAVVCGALLGVVYLALAWVLRCDEVMYVLQKLRNRLGRT